MPPFFCEKLAFFEQKNTFTKINSVRAVLEIFVRDLWFFIFCKTKGCYYWKHNFCRLCVRNPAPGLLQIGLKSEKWQWRHNFLTWRQRQYFLTLFCLVTDRSFMSMSSLVLELWQFSFIRDWPEIRKLEIPPSEFFPISEDWGKLCL